VVQSPIKRKLMPFRYRGRRERLYALIARRWRDTRDDDETLLALAKREIAEPTDQMLQQVPHWMFTFTAFGTDLLMRALALITARPAVRTRVIEEVAAAGPPNVAASIQQLDYDEACLLEAGRLFPPAVMTFHRVKSNGGRGHDVVHYFPLLQRDDALGPDVHDFKPERWLRDEPDEPVTASNLFLRGPRACPGSSLILFVCQAAIARLVAEHGLTASASALSTDPLPISFPKRIPRFATAEVSS
jgi:cytochrome P450